MEFMAKDYVHMCNIVEIFYKVQVRIGWNTLFEVTTSDAEFIGVKWCKIVFVSFLSMLTNKFILLN